MGRYYACLFYTAHGDGATGLQNRSKLLVDSLGQWNVVPTLEEYDPVRVCECAVDGPRP